MIPAGSYPVADSGGGPGLFPGSRREVEDAAKGAALAVGAKVQIRKYANTYVNMLNNLALAEHFRGHLTALGMQVETLSRRGVATDMGNVSWVAPSIHPFIATAPRGTAWHSTECAKASATPQAYDATAKTAKAFALTAIDLFSDPDLVRKIKEEFEGAVSRRNPVSRPGT